MKHPLAFLLLSAVLCLPFQLSKATTSIVPDDFGQDMDMAAIGLAMLQHSIDANAGDVEAQYQLGLNNVASGRLPEAIGYFEMASKQNHPGAQYYLGVAYLNGEGVEKNLNKALDYFSLSAEAGFPDAQAVLGTLSYTGIENILSPNQNAAFQWYLKAARNGHKPSQYNVAFCYFQGIGPNGQQYAEAYAWAKLGSEPAEGQQNDPQAAALLQHLDGVFNENVKSFSQTRYEAIKAELEQIAAKKASGVK